jgi:hypothetical protein
MMKTIRSSETSMTIYQTARRNISEKLIPVYKKLILKQTPPSSGTLYFHNAFPDSAAQELTRLYNENGLVFLTSGSP